MDVTAATTATAQDSGLRCPRCDYNLTGLTRPRCPECGATFTWEYVRALAERRPQIAFERARGWARLRGFIVTWATVLLAPWKFAGQAVRCVHGRAALVFGLICFAWTLLSFFFGADLLFLLTWWTVAAIYLTIQTPLLFLLDMPHWREGWRGLWFWAAVGGYTSAVVASEFYAGPPLIGLFYLLELVTGFGGGLVSPGGTFGTTLHWTQMILWLNGPALCYAARQRIRRGRTTPGHIVVSGCTWLLLLVLYGAVLDYLAEPVYTFYSDLF